LKKKKWQHKENKMNIKNNLGRYVLIGEIKKLLGDKAIKELQEKGQLKVGDIVLRVVKEEA